MEHMIKKILYGVWKDKSLARIYLNAHLEKIKLTGEVLDVGCGSNTKYLDFVPRASGMRMHIFDPKVGSTIDFEKDPLPYTENTFDMVLVFNVLEHVFSYDHLISEMKKVLKTEGVLHGFTPFLVRYHPDPHDFFRYTDEALARILSAHTFKNITVVPIGAGPCMAALNVFMLSIPRILRVVATPIAYMCDKVFLRFRPGSRSIYPMGYYFKATK